MEEDNCNFFPRSSSWFGLYRDCKPMNVKENYG